MPLVKGLGGRARGTVTLAIYTVAGATSSLLLGATLGVLGHTFIPQRVSAMALLATAIAAAAAAGRELGLLEFPLPQLQRQTMMHWGRVFDPFLAALLWGLDLGLLFTTRVAFAGVWVVALMALASREAGFGALLLLSLWFGRAMQVWVAAAFVAESGQIPTLLSGVYRRHAGLQRVNVFGLAGTIGAVASLLAQGTHL